MILNIPEILFTGADNIWERLHHFHFTPLHAIVGGVVAWVATVRLLRWRHYNAIHRKYGQKWDNGRGIITPEEAQKVCHLSMHYDMPLLLNYSISFALFKTYAIPTISRLLVATKQFSSKETVSRRYADTEILISTWFTCPISGFVDSEFARENKLKGEDARPAEDPRAMIAVARVNWLHSHYKISNDDFLYTLCLFITEPAAWAQAYGWRELSPLEKHCFYIFWLEIGKRMNIQNIPESFDATYAHSKQYEQKYMVPAKSNHDTAVHTLNELLAAAPQAFGLKNFGQRIAISLMDDIVRKAMIYPEQPWTIHAIKFVTLKLAAFIQGWLLFPRHIAKLTVDTSTKTHFEPGVCPRMYPTKWTATPWYRAEATGLGHYRDKLLVAIGWFNAMPGPDLKSGGYRLEEIGPSKFENSAHEEILQAAAELQGCPVVGPWSLDGRPQNA